MHSGRAYTIVEFLVWTRRTIYWVLLLSTIPVLLYEIAGWKWIAIPITVVVLLGTATAFLVGFKNTQTYNRTWEARQIWGSIINSSRSFGIMSRDSFDDSGLTRQMYYRHFAWLTALRFQLRETRAWENIDLAHNREYQRYYSIPERKSTLEAELKSFLDPAELEQVLQTKNRATQLLSNQSRSIGRLFQSGRIDSVQFAELEKILQDLYDHQGRSERIKNFPYPRQFATINKLFIRLFCILLPFGLLREFDRISESANSFNMIWLVIPFSAMISWVYASLEQVGESTENPFEGNANDVPITQISRTIEIDMREMIGETDLPEPIRPVNKIVL